MRLEFASLNLLFLHRTAPLLDLAARFLFRNAVSLLQSSDELVALSGDEIQIIIRQLTPSLLYLAFELFPFACDLIPIHNSPRNDVYLSVEKIALGVMPKSTPHPQLLPVHSADPRLHIEVKPGSDTEMKRVKSLRFRVLHGSGDISRIAAESDG
jgi:hypothetical protein